MICPPVILTIAGSDNSGGAGLQADLKTITTLGGYGTTAVTCVVAEHPGRVVKITPVAPTQVTKQIELVFEALPVAAVKTGMLYSEAIIKSVARALQAIGKKLPPLVVDPVMVASVGTPLLRPQAERALRELIFSLAACVTPNTDEAARLWGKPIRSLEELRYAGQELAQKYGTAFLMKGGHLKLSQAIDLLCEGKRVREFRTRTIPGANPHGTGCTLSAAIATRLGFGDSLEQSVAAGKRFITRAIRTRLKLGRYELLNQLPYK